jgi:hypothetical protein
MMKSRSVGTALLLHRLEHRRWCCCFFRSGPARVRSVPLSAAGAAFLRAHASLSRETELNQATRWPLLLFLTPTSLMWRMRGLPSCVKSTYALESRHSIGARCSVLRGHVAATTFLIRSFCSIAVALISALSFLF